MSFLRLPRHPIGIAGAFLSVIAAQAIVVLVILDITRPAGNPYLGIFTYLIFPVILAVGLAMIAIGHARTRRAQARQGGAPARTYFDPADPRHRRFIGPMVIGGLVLLFLTAGFEYRAYHFTESPAFCGQTCHQVMKPEFTAYQNSPHARVACVSCHVGPGASWWVKSKISGAHQLLAVAMNSYPRPIPGPIESLRPAQATCEQCHWPEKFHGAQLKLFTHYADDEANTRRQVQLLLKTGGGSASDATSSGIHWHMNIANDIRYIARDSIRQDIPWVEVTDRTTGAVRVFQSSIDPLTPEEIAAATPRRMDCMDCHNRPSHIFLPPAELVDQSLYLNRLDASLPYVRREAVAALDAAYPTEEDAMTGIAAHLTGFYETQYADLWAGSPDRVRAAIKEVQRIYGTSIFPEMKVSWKTYPTNIGHMYFPGCFRCHDGAHVTETGSTISKDCQSCHTVLGQIEGVAQHLNPQEPLGGGIAFAHPEDLGIDMMEANCSECHGPQ